MKCLICLISADIFRVVTMGFALEYLVILVWSLYGFRVPDLSIEQWPIHRSAPY
jgi:hypothetical protein